jgi:glycosyltransferase involved in cell wall biosynthesis
VDDHSTDDTALLIEQKLKGINYQILRLENDSFGKKEAIRRGIHEVQTMYILGMDADIVFDNDYFEHLENLTHADLYILPAVHKGSTFWQYLFEIDILLVNAVNAGISGWKRPILASGANLLYRKEAFLAYDRYLTHKHMPSGDDIYMLRDFRNGQADVRLISSLDLAVYTDTPKSFSEFLHQRLRWIAKTGDVKDHLSTTLAVLQVLLTAGYTIVLFSFWFNLQLNLFFMFCAAKVVIDVLLFLPFIAATRRFVALIYFPLYEFLFPLYSLLILVFMYTYKPIWKGRKLKRNF